MKPTTTLLTAFATIALSGGAHGQSGGSFGLRNGDTVAFYGDSITDARMYTIFTEAYVLTRFPRLNVRFVHSGWGGDRVTGGGGGPIDLRLDRDVFPYKPTVVTIMLGMNDGGYRAFDQGLADTFQKGYVHIVDSLKQRLPAVRLTLIQPSPYDDVTRPVGFPGGYNAVLLRYSDIVANIAKTNTATLADMNTPVVAMLTAANAKDPANAARMLPDRVHPGASGHLIMAEALLKSWNAPATVSSTQIDVQKGTISLDAGKVSKLSVGNGISWSSTEAALPYPVDVNDPLIALALASSDFVQSLDQQTIAVQGLDASKPYALSIDGQPPVVQATGAEWAAGINIATLLTPMQTQARNVMSLVRAHSDVHNTKWRAIQVPLANRTEGAKERDKAFKALDDYERSLFEAARKAAKPKEHSFSLVPVV